MDHMKAGLDPGGSGTSKLSMMVLDLGSTLWARSLPQAEMLIESSWYAGRAAIIVAGVASLVATVLACFSIWLQLKNYRKPLLQRYVVRILLMVPIYAISSWISLISLKAAFFVDPIRDIYEAFTIYTFFQLLINFLGGERSLIIMMHGRAPKEHVWPIDYILPKVDIGDPHTFLAIKRGILQYAWLKPVLAIAAIVMKATGTYQEGYVGLRSGYFWSGIIYNLSVTLSLYSLGMFWVCMSQDLQPFRPVPKFLCVKLIIFASYWQGFFLSILVWLGVIHDVGYYTPDNIARAIQDVLICFELPGFAVAHWYAFSWKDYADRTISAARLPVYYAFRDAFGVRDLIEDTKQTFGGKGYEYRLFDTSDNVVAHPESGSRTARMMEGLRYQSGGKGKYWIPKPTARAGLLSRPGPSDRTSLMAPGEAERGLNGMWNGGDYGALEETEIDEDDEKLFESARALEYGDYNYPVITAHEPWKSHRCNYAPTIPTTTTNQAFLRPKIAKKTKSSIKGKGKSNKREQKAPLLHHNQSSSSSSSNSALSSRSGVVDLIIEDTEAEEIERVRARKEGGPGWNEVEGKRFIRTYPDEHYGEEIRQGFDPASADTSTNTNVASIAKEAFDPVGADTNVGIAKEGAPEEHQKPEESNTNIDRQFGIGDDDDTEDESRGGGVHVNGDEGVWGHAANGPGSEDDFGDSGRGTSYGSLNEERNIWGRLE